MRLCILNSRVIVTRLWRLDPQFGKNSHLVFRCFTNLQFLARDFKAFNHIEIIQNFLQGMVLKQVVGRSRYAAEKNLITVYNSQCCPIPGATKTKGGIPCTKPKRFDLMSSISATCVI